MAQNEAIQSHKMLTAVSVELDATAVDSSSHNADIFLQKNYEMDVLSQFKANLNQVEELNMRLRFVMNEVSTLLSKRSR
ncbi:MAG: hypothetical protein ABL927_08675 [Bdellovibrionales bacterium]